MPLHRGTGDGEPLRAAPVGGAHDERLRDRTVLAHGTLACPACDAPVLPSGPLTPADPLWCGYCSRTGPVREFLSLEAPARATKVTVVVRCSPRGWGQRG